ncbi:endonuclease domain-containing protein [Aerosakkonema sp. BLCC-F183]|uniref:endonuclease domain-containing protein n=1 Tax=Aerosakkonema sp. BLCC-F183 TaxID=3342834 RepID=UPI0035B9711E
MALPQEVLVGILNTRLDLEIARDRHWYRIPVDSVNKFLKLRWPPQWIAFYQPGTFGKQAYAVRYYAQINQISEVFRWELFPELPNDYQSKKRYYKLEFSSLQRLPTPIVCRRARHLVFIQTTWKKFTNAVEINDLYDESPLEDKLWTEFKKLEINAERQEFVTVKNSTYALDFAIYCTYGKINIETDGDTWHADKERIPLDNERDNDLQTNGWHTLRFNTYHIQEKMTEYCLPTIIENINRLGGLKEEGRVFPRSIKSNSSAEFVQLSLF